ncbi:hypothetical protein V8G54_025518 [Vigna mungo]|uniref:Uncharacterized protein n=1 Tax=Vigna mungo TaxID=3915 RepID=A0AAQ3RP03_VIGMU
MPRCQIINLHFSASSQPMLHKLPTLLFLNWQCLMDYGLLPLVFLDSFLPFDLLDWPLLPFPMFPTGGNSQYNSSLLTRFSEEFAREPGSSSVELFWTDPVEHSTPVFSKTVLP